MTYDLLLSTNPITSNMTNLKIVNFFTILLVTVFFASYKGQVKTEMSQQETAVIVEQAKLIKSKSKYDGKTFTNF